MHRRRFEHSLFGRWWCDWVHQETSIVCFKMITIPLKLINCLLVVSRRRGTPECAHSVFVDAWNLRPSWISSCHVFFTFSLFGHSTSVSPCWHSPFLLCTVDIARICMLEEEERPWSVFMTFCVLFSNIERKQHFSCSSTLNILRHHISSPQWLASSS